MENKTSLVGLGIKEYITTHNESDCIRKLSEEISLTTAQIGKAIKEQNWGNAGVLSAKLTYLAMALKMLPSNAHPRQNEQ